MSIKEDATTIINNAQDYATSVFDAAENLVENAQRNAQGDVLLNGPRMVFQAEDVPTNIHLEGLPTDFTDTYFAPSDGDISLPTFNDYYIPAIPTFEDSPAPLDTSDLFKIDAPLWDVPNFTESAPIVDTNLNVPDAPLTVFPDAPESTSSLIAPVITAPTFDEHFDGVSPNPTADLVAEFEANYANILPQFREAIESYSDSFLLKHNPEYFTAMAQLESRLSTAMTSNSAITDAVEQQIFDRARERATNEQSAIERQYTDGHAKRGFAIPPGSLMGGVARAQEGASRSISGSAAEVAIQRAQIELQHLQFSMQLSASMRQSMIGYALQYHGNLVQINGQALDYARQIGALMVETFNQELQVYNAKIQVHQTLASVYQIRLESAFAELRSFEAQIAAEKLKTEVDQNYIAIYEAKIGAERLKIETYVAELRGVESVASIERLKVEIFESQVRAYAARVNGKEAEYGAYTSALKGDEAKVSVYSEQVRAYAATVDAATAKIGAEKVHSDSLADYNRLLIDQFEANVKKYETEINAEDSRYTNSVKGYSLALTRYTAGLDGHLKTLNLKYEKDQLELRAVLAEYAGNIQVLTEQADIFMSRNKTMSDAALAGGNIMKGLGSAAISANNTMVNLVSED